MLRRNPKSDRPRARRGFTMPELLVVIAIIGLLAALLFVVFGKAIKQALKVRNKVEHRYDNHL